MQTSNGVPKEGAKSAATAKGKESGSVGAVSHERYGFWFGGVCCGVCANDYRAFADYIFGSLILHFFCINFIN
jgi:hypothetical protein